MQTDLFALLSFVFITTFTPGPNNISSASLGILYGYRKTLNYLFGIIIGFWIIMLLSAIVSNRLLAIFPSVERVMRLFGALYILWLAYHTMKASYTFEPEDHSMPLGFKDGFLLQLINPKVMVYGMTLYTTFLSNITERPAMLFSSALIFALIGFCAISTWALFGAAIKTYLHNQKISRMLNAVLSLLLVYTAVELSGFL